MFLTHLSLDHFRNYAHLDLDFTRPLTLIQGQNAQGKTNLLEAIYFLATSKAAHAGSEREVVGWGAEHEPIPYSRVAARVRPGNFAGDFNDAREGRRPLELEIVLTQREGGSPTRNSYKKQVKINGVAKRNLDLIGLMRAVLFLPEDTVLVAGGPSERRRYLDVALCQIDREYTRNLARYQKVVTQRNGLLKSLREQGASPRSANVDAQLGFWDEKLIAHGAAILTRRWNFLQTLERIACERHRELSDGRESLALHYLPSFNPGALTDFEYAALKDDRLRADEFAPLHTLLSADEVAGHFVRKLHERRPREIAAGNTLYGPHRDDFRFLASVQDGNIQDSEPRNLRTYGSRGQQRTAALALKLAEVQAMTEATGEPPLLLLDDVMSELDASRRATLLTALAGVHQAVITTTDWADFSEAFREEAQLLHVEGGAVRGWTESAETDRVK